MSLDAYAYCPCSSGKKLKFCCCKDLVHELDKVFRAMSGDQRAAALEHLERLIAEYGKRPALLAMKAECCLIMGNLEETEKTCRELLEIMPHGPTGLALQAVVHASHGEVDLAVERLQEALEVTEGPISSSVYAALGLVGDALLGVQRVFAARAHYIQQLAFGGEEQEGPGETLERIDGSPGVPIVLKEDLVTAVCPPGVPWQGEFNAAMKSAARGAWLAACECLESLDQKVGGQPAVIKNIAIMRTWLGQEAQAVESWRKYAALPGLPIDEAIDAELYALKMAARLDDDYVDIVQRTYSVPDVERCMEFLLSEKCVDSMERDPKQRAEGEPPPKGSFLRLDRAMPTSADAVQTIDDVPVILGEIDVYGKQTDRDARLELVLEQNDAFASRRTEIEKWLGDRIGSFQSETVVGKRARHHSELMTLWRVPPFLPPARQVELMKEASRRVLNERWSETATSLLGGKTPREAAAFPELRNRVSAMILALELGAEVGRSNTDADYNAIRRKLGLPERVAARIPSEGIAHMSNVAIGSLDFGTLSDDDLLFACEKLSSVRYVVPLERCALEILKRDSLTQRVNIAQVYRLLAGVTTDFKLALGYIDKGRRWSASKGENLAPWYLLELQIRLINGDVQEAMRVLNTTVSRYGNDMEVKQQLFEILARFGLINPDGSPAIPSARQGAAPAESAEPAGPTIWTPETAAAPQARQESKLWLPGT